MLRMDKRASMWLHAITTRHTVIISIKTALVVGPILTAINQWEAITGQLEMNWLKVVLTFLVPYMVSTYSSAATLCRNTHQK